MKYRSTSFILSTLILVILFASPLAALARDKGGRDNNDRNKSSWFSKTSSSLKGWSNNLGNSFGHLIAPGWLKHNGASTTIYKDRLPFGIGKKTDNNSNNYYRYDKNRGDNGNHGYYYGSGRGNGNSTTTPISGTPVINGITSPTTLSVNQTGTWTVQASDSMNNPLNYSVNWGDRGLFRGYMLSAFSEPFVQTSTFTHSYSSSGTYKITFTVRDVSSGRTAVSTVTVQVTDNGTTTNPLVLSGLSASAQQNQAQISWNTNNAANSEIWYGTTTPVDVSASPKISQGALVFNHFLLLNNLFASTTYYFTVRSRDSYGNTATSSESTFNTYSAPYANPLTLSNAVAVVGSSTVKLTWNTNLSADSEAYFSTSSPVIIGATSTTAVTDATLKNTHSLTVSGLATSTTYYFIIQSKDVANDTSSTGQFFVTTSSI